jgi:ABC-type dipeptide/oligopeptide/nickel transport system permease subunit
MSGDLLARCAAPAGVSGLFLAIVVLGFNFLGDGCATLSIRR